MSLKNQIILELALAYLYLRHTDRTVDSTFLINLPHVEYDTEIQSILRDFTQCFEKACNDEGRGETVNVYRLLKVQNYEALVKLLQKHVDTSDMEKAIKIYPALGYPYPEYGIEILACMNAFKLGPLLPCIGRVKLEGKLYGEFEDSRSTFNNRVTTQLHKMRWYIPLSTLETPYFNQ